MANIGDDETQTRENISTFSTLLIADCPARRGSRTAERKQVSTTLAESEVASCRHINYPTHASRREGGDVTSMAPWVVASCWVASGLIMMLLFSARDAIAFPLQSSYPTRKASYTDTLNTLLWLYPTSTAVSRSCWSCAAPSATSHPTTVLATSDTLPNFSTARGLLSPDVVMRIVDSNDLELNGPLDTFLDTYLSRGPMACLSMLSDPKILPELTKAMRAVV
ncbi:hypothetical protein QTG54_000383 [Skeletonema marinoi]|uniref:Uncharacterized protein n=1 Tax=Skeletonema marinoi TaxID=267567 RepID=A0AAD8YN05_9STRA|nr:hypothetical protein QTG54_000383 [Skeletonema marinoi]